MFVLLSVMDHIRRTTLLHLREKFPGPEGDPGPQLSEEDSSAQVRFDLRQQFRGLPVQPVRVRQQAVINNLLLRDKPTHVLVRRHIPPLVTFRLYPEKKIIIKMDKEKNVALYLNECCAFWEVRCLS